MATRKQMEKEQWEENKESERAERSRRKCPPDLAQNVTRDFGATLEWIRVSKSEEVEA